MAGLIDILAEPGLLATTAGLAKGFDGTLLRNAMNSRLQRRAIMVR
jgi:hypothetical protein